MFMPAKANLKESIQFSTMFFKNMTVGESGAVCKTGF